MFHPGQAGTGARGRRDRVPDDAARAAASGRHRGL